MTTVSIKEAKNKLSELTKLAEKGETVTITRNGTPIADLVAHKKRGGVNLKALQEYKKKHGITRIVDYIPADFDDPLPEDFLIKPLP